MIVMGGIIGSGIFMNPAVVAREVHTPFYGWTLLLVIQTGGMAAVALTFALYFIELIGVSFADWVIASIALALLTFINCLGVRAGSTVQSILMVLKILAIAALIVCGFLPSSAAVNPATGMFVTLLDRSASFDLLTAFGAGMIPVLFAYGGWQTASFIAGEVREPQRTLPRALLIGVAGRHSL